MLLLSGRRYVHTGVVPGMALYLNCTDDCQPADTDRDVTWMYSDNTSSWTPVNHLSDDNYVRSRDGGLVILRVNSSQHRGTFYCTSRPAHTDRVIVEHTVTMSGQSSVYTVM